MPDRPPEWITATQLRDLDACEHRFHLDVSGDPADRDEVGGFVRMLWEGGVAHERAILDRLPGPIADLREVPREDRFHATAAAIADRIPTILGAAISHSDLYGMPDLLRLDERGYVAADVKNGAAFEPGGPTGRRLKRSYGVQLAHYAAILVANGWGPAGVATVIDHTGWLSEHDLDLPMAADGTTTAGHHAHLVARARLTRRGVLVTSPAASAACAQCHWRSRCRAELVGRDDPTLIPDIGRSARLRLGPTLSTVREIASANLADHADAAGRSTIRGISIERLERFRDRARLLSTPGSRPFARRPLELPRFGHEIHYDVESDPLNGGTVYLHGFLERIATPDGARITTTSMFADDPADERAAFENAWGFLAERPAGHLYVWSRFERTSMRSLRERHPGVCTAADVEALFAAERCTDLYTDVVAPATEWPLSSYGLKKIARHVGFEWRDEDPSGASSIAWFAEWLKTRDPAMRERIVRYNEDDVAATAAVLDFLRTIDTRG